MKRELHAGYLITISSLFFALSVGLLFLIYEEQKVLTHPANENEVWASYTLMLETYKLSNELSRFESNESTLESVYLRFEILYSRIIVLNNGKLKKIILTIPDSLMKLNEVMGLINGLDTVVFSKNNLTKEKISYIKNEIDKIRQATEIMMFGILENRANQKVERRDSLTSLFSLLILLLLFLIVTVSLIILSLFKQKKAINQSYLIERELSVNLNEALKKSEKATQAKSDFLATMSHEIRTPMNGIMGLGYLLSNTKLDEKQSEYLEKIQDSANNLLLIINDILDLSKVEAGKLELEERKFSLDDILDNIYDLNSVKAKEKGILFFVERDFNLPDNYLGDPLRINQLLLNLVSNAVKFTHTGEVRVGISSYFPRNNEYDVKTDDNRILKVVVSDTGIGMEKRYAEILFDSFTQADTTTTRKYGGTGLGLAICKRFVDLMQGNIYVDSEFGKGTVFTVELPLKVVSMKPDQNTSTYNEVSNDVRIISKKIGVVGFKDGVNELLYLYGYDTVKLTDSNDLNSNESLDAVVILDYDVFLKKFFSELNSSIHSIPYLVFCNIIIDREYIVDDYLNGYFLNYVFTPKSLIDNLNRMFSKQKASNKIDLYDFDFSGKKVLLVEDNEINTTIVLELLEERGMYVVCASDGKDATGKVKIFSFDIILMDIQMPIMDGYEATKIIIKELGSKAPPIIAMTANILGNDKEYIKNIGMSGFISKPINPIGLFNVMKRQLEKTGAGVFTENANIIEKIPPTLVDYGQYSSILNAFQQAGIDTNSALPNVNADVNRLYSLLLQYISELKEGYFQLEKNIFLGNTSHKKNMCHNLKGVSLNLGAQEIGALLSEMENERDRAVLSSQLQKLNVVIKKLERKLADISPSMKCCYSRTASRRKKGRYNRY